MHSICHRTAALWLIAGAFACPSTRPSPRPPARPPRPTVDGPTGGAPTHNGLHPEVYHRFQDALQQRMQAPLTPAPGELDPRFDALLRASPALVADAVSCAVPDGTVTRFAGAPYATHAAYINPRGVLLPTSGWPDSPLSPRAREVLHACLATRLNPVSRVDIWLGGSDVVDDGAAHPEFVVREALWSAIERSNPGARPTIALQVWPSDTLRASCEQHVEDAVRKRVCGSRSAAACGLELRFDQDQCKRTAGDHWTCPRSSVDPTPVEVIETRLRCEDWFRVYTATDCNLPPECRAPPAR